MDILIDFLNLPQSVAAVREFQQRCQVYKEKFPADMGSYTRVDSLTIDKKRGYSGTYTFHLISRDQFERLHGRGPYGGDSWRISAFFPEDDGFYKLWERLEEERTEYREFIAKCQRGQVDYEFLNSLWVSVLYSNPQFIPSADPMKPKTILTRPRPEDLSGILGLDVLNDFMIGNGPEYRRIRQCLECTKYVAGKSTKRAYCSAVCRNERHYKMRKNRALKSA